MPPRLPDRYHLNVRLGNDGDVEEWLATDDSLDRPVLVRALGPEATLQRNTGFIGSVRAAASVAHPHLQKIFAAATEADVAYSISEWDGGVSAADRLRAGEPLPVEEFLSNAAGLADALAQVHLTGAIHGAIDPSAIHFSAAHPAKLGAFGRTPRYGEPKRDVAALSAALRESVTGSKNAVVKPSHVVDGLPRAVDQALEDGEIGSLTAAQLAAALQTIPYAPPKEETGTVSWKPIAAFVGVAFAIVVIAAVGLAIRLDPDSPFLFPASPGDRPQGDPPTVVAVPAEPEGSTMPATAAVYDPLGDGVEGDESLGAVSDDDPETAWRTEPYTRPLHEIKSGVGLQFEVGGDPTLLELSATPGTRFRIGWAASLPVSIDEWQDAGSGSSMAGGNRIQLPLREGGRWLLWFTDLPEQEDGSYQTAVTGVRFLP